MTVPYLTPKPKNVEYKMPVCPPPPTRVACTLKPTDVGPMVFPTLSFQRHFDEEISLNNNALMGFFHLPATPFKRTSRTMPKILPAKRRRDGQIDSMPLPFLLRLKPRPSAYTSSSRPARPIGSRKTSPPSLSRSSSSQRIQQVYLKTSDKKRKLSRSPSFSGRAA
eukprot:CAMPEP_0181132042 /NCGR_PEP_ID=MMETSP1071-20121207/30783_1 /TAXON_ID=35127 /ORGANISM="Thalassiosira sp., Strain NH16" /LENGTH=165 /DNA_ID=CAMNT_0023218347 /DNA_START=244 /DNA_END=741 /DNA_ORIENTATION=+